MHVNICIMCLVPRQVKIWVGFLVPGVERWLSYDVYARNLGPLQEQQTLLIAVPSLQPSMFSFNGSAF